MRSECTVAGPFLELHCAFANKFAFVAGLNDSGAFNAIMTAIPAKVVAVDRQSDQYRVIVRIGLAKYRGSFNTLKFGEKKPFTGFCRDGQLDLVYFQDPGLEAGESFPLWTIQ